MARGRAGGHHARTRAGANWRGRNQPAIIQGNRFNAVTGHPSLLPSGPAFLA
ncbi:hypothetical protein ACP4OV_011689 [Aristida adscensionis]